MQKSAVLSQDYFHDHCHGDNFLKKQKRVSIGESCPSTERRGVRAKTYKKDLFSFVFVLMTTKYRYGYTVDEDWSHSTTATSTASTTLGQLRIVHKLLQRFAHVVRFCIGAIISICNYCKVLDNIHGLTINELN